MADAPAVPARAPQLVRLAECLEAHPGFVDVVSALAQRGSATLDGVWGSSCALVAAALLRHAPGPLVVVCAQPNELDDFCDDLALFTPAAAARFPAWEGEAGEQALRDELYGDRLRTLKLLRGPAPPPVVVASLPSLLQKVPAPRLLAETTRHIRRGEMLEVEGLARWLASHRFHATTAVELPGEYSLRGGILDIFAPDADLPVRIELFGDEVESIRTFEVATQRSLGPVESVELTVLGPAAGDGGHLAEYLPAESWLLLLEPEQLEAESARLLERTERPGDYFSLAETFRRIDRFGRAAASGLARDPVGAVGRLQVQSVQRFSGDVGKVRQELEQVGEGCEVFVVSQTEAEIERLREIFAAAPLAARGQLHFPLGRLRTGFQLPAERVLVISGAEMFHRADVRRLPRRHVGKVIDSFLELREGDLVVHLAHGIGRYRGMKLITKDRRAEEHLELEFHGGTRIYVPTAKIDLVQKYVGGRKARPVLARIGGRSWARQKRAAAAAVSDLASDMLELQAKRAARPGIALAADTDWQREFDASFPYHETPDQLVAVEAIKRDMRAARPMDRLLCGDVGFGKTELAMRAAFKAVDNGYQVAVLVPTTILAEQHFRTFTERLAEFPFQVAKLSRFCTPRQQREVLEGLQSGRIDVVVGTHRLASSDVQFHNLGLLVIDEEQRFGVEVKDRLKSLRTAVDVLTLTATPIPRTLHMSLTGMRDISNLETPPEDRLAVETRVTRWQNELVRHAVLRELNRGGQVYFVHNRIHDIHAVARRLEQIVPEARLRIGHGQMPEAELEQVMLDFVNHEFDLLLATTIVESGLDIPNANTIFIDDADRYGLADLHQLRGRVGRYKHRAYCYLLIDPRRSVTPNAARRLRAIEEFSDMGAGFAIAMRDLEIRGAGNILGTQQSGHIATVGYELYCQLLEQAVRQLKHLPPEPTIDVSLELPVEAYLPPAYVPDMRAKIDLYRRLARLTEVGQIQPLRGELIDRFGPLPEPAERLLVLAELRMDAAAWWLRSVHLEPPYLVLGYRDRGRIEQLSARHRGRLRIVDQQSAYLSWREELARPESILGALKSVLRPA